MVIRLGVYPGESVMPGTTKDLHGVLDDYRKFLREKNLAPPAHQPYLVRWVRAFLLFARAHAGYSFEQTLDLFLAECCGSVTVRGPAQLTPKPEYRPPIARYRAPETQD
ncbi:MAG: hypothetical protein ACQESR_28320 [Planctomycetota bacterium]